VPSLRTTFDYFARIAACAAPPTFDHEQVNPEYPVFPDVCGGGAFHATVPSSQSQT
jgi:hypothetical protein